MERAQGRGAEGASKCRPHLHLDNDFWNRGPSDAATPVAMLRGSAATPAASRKTLDRDQSKYEIFIAVRTSLIVSWATARARRVPSSTISRTRSGFDS